MLRCISSIVVDAAAIENAEHHHIRDGYKNLCPVIRMRRVLKRIFLIWNMTYRYSEANIPEE